MKGEIQAAASAAAAAANASGYGRADCPTCEERKGSPGRNCFWFRVESGHYGCWRCGLAGRIGTAGPRVPVRCVPVEPPPVHLPEDAVPLWTPEARGARSLAGAFAFLIEKRDFSLEAIQRARVHACLRGGYAGRVLFPVARHGRPAGFVARSWGASDRPYLYPAGFSRANFWNGDAIDTPHEHPLLIVEGVFDALRWFPHAVACLGKPSAEQVQNLQASPRRLVIALDSDAWREGAAVATKLKIRGASAVALRLPGGHDPDTIGLPWLRKQVAGWDQKPL